MLRYRKLAQHPTVAGPSDTGFCNVQYELSHIKELNYPGRKPMWGRSSVSRVMRWTAMRERTSLSHAKGSKLQREEIRRVLEAAAARSYKRSLPLAQSTNYKTKAVRAASAA